MELTKERGNNHGIVNWDSSSTSFSLLVSKEEGAFQARGEELIFILSF
jgi:hypothetical protein